jgi:DNA mismatch endonuclease (patch repair protein)
MADTFTPEQRSRIMSLIRSKDTKPELIVRRLVHSMGYRYRLHVRALPGSPDLVFPKFRKVINVSGCFWHMHTCRRFSMPKSRKAYWTMRLNRNRRRDRRTLVALRRLGWDVLTVWQCQLSDQAKLARRIQSFFSDRHHAKKQSRETVDVADL